MSYVVAYPGRPGGALDRVKARLAHRGTAEEHALDGAVVAGGALARESDAVLACDAFLNGSDTADPARSLLAAWRAGSGAAIEALRGEYAFALYDARERTFVLGRDFYGTRPLYIARTPRGLAAASEIKGLLALDSVTAEPDLEMLQWVQHTKKLPPGRTVFKGIEEVPPGTVLVLDRTGTELDRHTFTSLELDLDVPHDEDLPGELLERIEESLLLRAADVEPLGLALSGGIDSIGLAYLLRRAHPERELHVFTASSWEGDPEEARARRVADEIGAEHHVVPTPPALLSELRELVWHLEAPLYRSGALQLLAIGREAANHVPLLITGQAADALFAGMPRCRILELMRKAPPPVRGALGEIYSLTQVSSEPESLIAKAVVGMVLRGRIPAPPRIRGATGAPGPLSFPEMDRQFVNRVLVSGCQAGMARDTPKYERTFRAFGVEHRCPFHDVPLGRYSFSIDARHKIRGRVRKYILREAFERIVPEELAAAPKFPQRMRIERSFSDALDEIATDVLAPDRIRARGFFEVEDLQRLRRGSSQRPYAHEAAMRLWTAILTELWARAFLDGEDAPGQIREAPARREALEPA